MALTTAQQVRLRIQDIPALANDTHYGDGTATLFVLPHANVTSGSAYVPIGGTAWTATGAAFNASGYVQFSGIIPANSAFRLSYVYSTFSDDEINHFTAVGGSVNGAALEAVQALMFDSLKRARWMAPDGSQHDDTQAQGQLMRMYEAFKSDAKDDAIGGGAVESWALNQEAY